MVSISGNNAMRHYPLPGGTNILKLTAEKLQRLYSFASFIRLENAQTPINSTAAP